MSIAEKLQTIAENELRVYEAGFAKGQSSGGGGGYDEGYEAALKAEYDRFWDGWLENGNRLNFKMAFSGDYWTDETFSPRYDIVPRIAERIFEGTKIVDLIGCLERCAVIMDFSQCQTFNYMLTNGATIKHFPPIDLSASAGFQDGFRYASSLESASLVNVAEKHTWSNAFANCSSLVDLSISGTIGKTISFAQSKLLSEASVQNIIDVLADLTGQTAQTITFHKDVGAKLTDAQKNTISDKNWTLAY